MNTYTIFTLLASEQRVISLSSLSTLSLMTWQWYLLRTDFTSTVKGIMFTHIHTYICRNTVFALLTWIRKFAVDIVNRHSYTTMYNTYIPTYIVLQLERIENLCVAYYSILFLKVTGINITMKLSWYFIFVIK